MERFSTGGDSSYGGLLDTGSKPAPAYEPGAGITAWGDQRYPSLRHPEHSTTPLCHFRQRGMIPPSHAGHSQMIPPLRHPGRDSEPGSSCSEKRFNTGSGSNYGGLLDTGSGPV
ncbi:hypothetical protein [Spongiibacter sp. IMCC21906]|uniref:hypothetical protein n=1 Tax=Spongiibacter sp. IMCC21906 TaxID=1620392 RepID=UPI0012E03D17|nr:hypothetical protein [Spongiibacter sp. IMCC21906]